MKRMFLIGLFLLLMNAGFAQNSNELFSVTIDSVQKIEDKNKDEALVIFLKIKNLSSETITFEEPSSILSELERLG